MSYCDECGLTLCYERGGGCSSHLRREAAAPSEQELFIVRLTCCGRSDGTYGPVTWAEADAFRESYLSGPGVDDGGHRRSAIVEAA